jgi:hypothetical protein
VTELVKKSGQEQQEQEIETSAAVKRIAGFTMVATAAAVFAALVATAVYAQDKYLLKSLSGIAFSDRTDEILKAIVADPMMIKAYKAGVSGNSQPFPEGSMIVKLQWKLKKSTEAPFAVEVPDAFVQAFVMEKTSRDFRIPVGGDPRCLTTMPHRTSLRLILKASQTAQSLVIRL